MVGLICRTIKKKVSGVAYERISHVFLRHKKGILNYKNGLPRFPTFIMCNGSKTISQGL